MTLCVEGNISAGKSTFLNLIEETINNGLPEPQVLHSKTNVIKLAKQLMHFGECFYFKSSPLTSPHNAMHMFCQERTSTVSVT